MGLIATLIASAMLFSVPCEMTGLSSQDISDVSVLSSESHGYGQGVQTDENNRPLGALNFNDENEDYNSYAIFDDDKGICLTFDQGYENGYTEKILDTLNEKNVKAVFFLTGDYAKRNKDLVQRMIDEGHTIGNHGMKHLSLPKLSPEEAEDEIMSLHSFVKDEYGVEMSYLRPPCGEYSEQALAICGRLGYKTMLWSYAYCDWDVDNQPEPTASLEKAVNAAHNGAIYLLHSVSSTNAEILPQLIDEIRAEGFEFTLPE